MTHVIPAAPTVEPEMTGASVFSALGGPGTVDRGREPGALNRRALRCMAEGPTARKELRRVSVCPRWLAERPLPGAR